MDEALHSLTKISRSTVITLVIAVGVAFLAGPNNWATHLAYHNWNAVYAFLALHPLSQAALSVVVTTLVYLQFEEKIRFVATSLFYSEEAAVMRVNENKALRAAALRNSQLSSGSPATGA